MNRDMLTGGEIVPGYEDSLDLKKRRYTDDASNAGKFIQNASTRLSNAIGKGDELGIDSRKADYVIQNGIPYYGRAITRASDIGRADRPRAGEQLVNGMLSVTDDAPSTTSRSVLKANRNAAAAGLSPQSKAMQLMTFLRREAQAADDANYQEKAKALRDFAKSDAMKVFTEMEGKRRIMSNDIGRDIINAAPRELQADPNFRAGVWKAIGKRMKGSGGTIR
jgi:hypothetical protein